MAAHGRKCFWHAPFGDFVKERIFQHKKKQNSIEKNKEREEIVQLVQCHDPLSAEILRIELRWTSS